MDEKTKQELLDSAAHWDELAEAEDRMKQWLIENGLSHLVCPSYGHRAAMYRSAAKRNRLQAEDGIPRCRCHGDVIHPLATCPNNPANQHGVRR